ncbi:uncharacterized protein LAJ45_06299 [Morchella importuna]|uniref:uncharacterized protein n=1 Tax=Morchella importuna TaxID=1174673 RepID=UPI001E8E5C89|nr:uncharacterized protein LAJ45_06299 [Morchella importuna]KAH8149668.1 hypothetical protein LAJ45_06299 [Morchella importuna]
MVRGRDVQISYAVMRIKGGLGICRWDGRTIRGLDWAGQDRLGFQWGTPTCQASNHAISPGLQWKYTHLKGARYDGNLRKCILGRHFLGEKSHGPGFGADASRRRYIRKIELKGDRYWFAVVWHGGLPAGDDSRRALLRDGTGRVWSVVGSELFRVAVWRRYAGCGFVKLPYCYVFSYGIESAERVRDRRTPSAKLFIFVGSLEMFVQA